MRTTILAAALAVAASAAMIVPLQAASVTITTGDEPIIREDNGRHFGWENGRHYGWENGRHRHRHWREREVQRDCEVRTTRYWRDGQLVVERTRDCY